MRRDSRHVPSQNASQEDLLCLRALAWHKDIQEIPPPLQLARIYTHSASMSDRWEKLGSVSSVSRSRRAASKIQVARHSAGLAFMTHSLDVR